MKILGLKILVAYAPESRLILRKYKIKQAFKQTKTEFFGIFVGNRRENSIRIRYLF